MTREELTIRVIEALKVIEALEWYPAQSNKAIHAEKIISICEQHFIERAVEAVESEREQPIAPCWVDVRDDLLDNVTEAIRSMRDGRVT